jgi:4-hydroxy 2-oxovalerate aldolase
MYVTNFVTDDAIKCPTIDALARAGVAIIECGFLGAKETEANSAIYASPYDFAPYILPKRPDVLYAAICMSLSDIDIEHFPERTPESLDGIRIAFFKWDLDEAVTLAAQVKAKGYEVIMQPMRTSDYAEGDIDKMIGKMNELAPYGLAIVDSTGNMTPGGSIAVLDRYEDSLDKTIRIGFHFHNNYQLAFANALAMLGKVKPDREYILDASIFGMGRGAGNLPIELIMNYLNSIHDSSYDTHAIYDVYDRHYKPIHEKTPWGYALRYLIAATYDVNVYYAGYLFDKYGFDDLTIEEIIRQIPAENKASVNFELADTLARKAKGEGQ